MLSYNYLTSAPMFMLTLILWSVSVSAATNPYARSLVDIDDLCVITNEMERDYAIEGMGIAQKSSAERLKQAEERFKNEFSDVENAKLSPGFHNEVKGLENDWDKIRTIVTSQPDKSEVKQLDKAVTDFTGSCEKLAQEIQSKSDVSGSKDALLLSKYNVDTQRLATMYMLRAWGEADANYQHDANELLTESSKVISSLSASSQLSRATKQRLAHIQKQFKLFEFMVARPTKRFVPALINTKADTIVNEINAVLDKELAVLGIAGTNKIHEVKLC